MADSHASWDGAMWAKASCGRLCVTEPNVRIGDGECGKLMCVIGSPMGGGIGVDCCPCGTIDDSGSEGEAKAEESSTAVVTSVTTGAEATGRWGTPPKPCSPNCGYPYWLSMAVRRAP